MSDPRPTARELIDGWWKSEMDVLPIDNLRALTAAITADRAASDAREDLPREALERIQAGGCDRINDGKRMACEQAGTMSRCSSCIASRCLAAIPPRSDR